MKKFGDNTAVDGITLDVRAGSFFGIVGPNGAGKTTTLSMVTGLLRPDAGTVRINGIDAWADPAPPSTRPACCPTGFACSTGSRVPSSCTTRACCAASTTRTVRERSTDLIAAFGLEDAVDRLVADYSAGMTKKIALACAMIHAPRLLVLDEPFESVDPVSAANLTEILERYVDGRRHGRAVQPRHGPHRARLRFRGDHRRRPGARIRHARRGARRAHPRRPLRRARRRTQGSGRHGMVAQFLRLKLRLLGNIFRRSPWQVVGISLGLVYGVGIAALLFLTLVSLRFVGDVELIRDVFIVVGAATMVGFVVLPLLFGVDDTMDPRRFALFGLPDRTLALGLGVAAMIGIPALVLAIVLAGTVVTWSRGVGETILALLAAALAFATCLLLARVATGVASVLLATRRAREVSGVLGVLLIVLLSPIIVVLVTLDWANSGLRVLETLAGVLGWTPSGAAFAAPGDAAAGDWGPAILKFIVAVVTLGAIWLGWQALVARMLVTPGREASAKSYRGLGWFDRMPHTATGAVAARSITYWFRDARYWVSFIMVPIVPLLVIVPLGLAGVPSVLPALIPVPLMCLFLGWASTTTPRTTTPRSGCTSARACAAPPTGSGDSSRAHRGRRS